MTNFTNKAKNTKAKPNPKHKTYSGSYIAHSKRISSSQVFRMLSAIAHKLYFNLMDKYTGFNNGDLSLVYKDMHDTYGWTSTHTLLKAINELLTCGLLIKTRQGGRNKCCLYALTAYWLDDCKGKLDSPWREIKETNIPIGGWAGDPLLGTGNG